MDDPDYLRQVRKTDRMSVVIGIGLSVTAAVLAVLFAVQNSWLLAAICAAAVWVMVDGVFMTLRHARERDRILRGEPDPTYYERKP